MQKQIAVVSGSLSVQPEINVQCLIAKWAALQNTNLPVSIELALEICKILQNQKSYILLGMFLNALPENEMYSKNEQIIRAKISLALEMKNFRLVCDLIKNNEFQHGDDLIDIWDSAHYAEDLERTKRPHTALSRFRIRQRFPPPRSICPQGGRKIIGLPRASKLVLQQWLDENVSDPYPSKETKDNLSKKANITTQQVKTWFANARRRLTRIQRRENGYLSWKRCKRRGENKEDEKTVQTASNTSPENDDKSGECKTFEESLVRNEDSYSSLPHHEDHDPAIDHQVNGEVSMYSQPSPFPSCTDPVSLPRTSQGNTSTSSMIDSPLENSPSAHVSVPPLQLVHPLPIVNPTLYGPAPLTYFFDYYSYLPINYPVFTMHSISSPLSVCSDGNTLVLSRLIPSYVLPEQVTRCQAKGFSWNSSL